MDRGATGSYRQSSTSGEVVSAFIPYPLPPEPPLVLGGSLDILLDRASTAIGRLDGISAALPDPGLLLYTYVRKEAVLSSQIEGTQSSLSDLLRHEVDHVANALLDDVAEVSCYVDAMQFGLSQLQSGIPVSLRLIRDIHSRLLASGRGSGKQPGEYRTSQNWIGGSRPGTARFVPPPPDAIMECMGALELFIHDQPVRTRPLLKAALVHVQFETIHPFLDGNGRLGRLLITLLLCAEGVLSQPLLYLSLHFKQHRQDYYRLLQLVRETGDWESWLEFFLTGVESTANTVFETSKQLLELFSGDRELIAGETANTQRLHELLQKSPAATIASAAQALSVALPTASRSLMKLVNLGILHEITGSSYGRVFVYKKFLDILESND